MQEFLLGCSLQCPDRTFVVVAWAQSINGIIGSLETRVFLSSPESLQLTHQIRSRSNAILVGVNTIISDDPRLTVAVDGDIRVCSAIPVILDSSLKTPLKSRIFDQGHDRILIFTVECVTPRAKAARTALEGKGATVICVRAGLDLSHVLETLHELGVALLMVEGGSLVLQSFLYQGLADAAIVTISPQFIPRGVGLSGHAFGKALMLPHVQSFMYGCDIVLASRIPRK